MPRKNKVWVKIFTEYTNNRRVYVSACVYVCLVPQYILTKLSVCFKSNVINK